MKTLNLLLLFAIFFISCSDRFLDLKSDKQLVVPSKVEDYQAMLDYPTLMNNGGGFTFGEMSTDDYYLTEERFNRLSNLPERNAYIWSPDIFNTEASYDWNRN